MYKRFIKPVSDFILALISVIVLSPVFLICIIVLLIVNRGKVFFIQQRPGKNAKLFSLIKFRTMVDRKDNNGILLPDSLRITKTGKFMRLYSIDELPQLINILSGKMSFVGPRPLLAKYIPLYSPRQARRHEVKPGLTGWTQVNGRNNLAWEQKFELDVYYVENLSFFLDLEIFFKTIPKVLGSAGVMVVGRKNQDRFDVYRAKQIKPE